MALLGRGGVANVYLRTFNTALYVVIWLEIVRSVEFLNIRLKSLKEEIETRGGSPIAEEKSSLMLP